MAVSTPFSTLCRSGYPHPGHSATAFPQMGQRIGFDCARRSFAKTRKLGWRSRKVSSQRLKLLSADFDGLYDAYTRVSSSWSVTLLPAVFIAVCARWSSTRGNFVQLQVALPVRSFHWS